jgi:hypothetical protein
MAEYGGEGNAIVPFMPLSLYWPGRAFIGSTPVSFVFRLLPTEGCGLIPPTELSFSNGLDL